MFLVWALLVAPFAVGLFGLWRMEHFRREAFGHLKASTFFMMVAVLFGLAYYAFVLVAVSQTKWVAQMTAWPLTPMGALLYAQSLFACAALAAFGLAGTHAWRVTVPGQPAARRKAETGPVPNPKADP